MLSKGMRIDGGLCVQMLEYPIDGTDDTGR